MTVDNVFDDAISKLETRTKRYLPLKSNFSLQSRVIIANVFLLPLLSFVFRFFLMPTSQQKKVSKIITEWLGLANRYTFDQLTTPRRNGGLHHPLRDVNQLNLAAILSNLPEIPALPEAKPPLKISSLCISKHISAAAAKFFAITDTKATPETCQQNLSKTLHLHDDTPLRALAKKLNPTNPEKTIGREAAITLATTIMKCPRPTCIPAQRHQKPCFQAHPQCLADKDARQVLP